MVYASMQNVCSLTENEHTECALNPQFKFDVLAINGYGRREIKAATVGAIKEMLRDDYAVILMRGPIV